MLNKLRAKFCSMLPVLSKFLENVANWFKRQHFCLTTPSPKIWVSDFIIQMQTLHLDISRKEPKKASQFKPKTQIATELLKTL